jgi:hypothetical protein
MNPLDDLARTIATAFWDAMILRAPDLRDKIEENILNLASEKFWFVLQDHERITQAVDKRITELLATTFKPALDEIARRKAKEKVKARARQNGIEPSELPGMGMRHEQE